MSRTNATTSPARRIVAGVPRRLALFGAVAALGLGGWLLPARAQDHGAPAGGHSAPVNAPAPAPAEGGHTPVATPHGEAPVVSAPGERGSHQGAQEPGPGGTHGPQGGTHEIGQPAGEHGAPAGEHGAPAGEHGAASGHGAGGEHGAAGGHGEHAEEEAPFEIHLPSWIYGPLKTFWFGGPATLNADGAVDAGGQSVAAATLKGQQVDYTYQYGHGHHKTDYKIRPVIGAIGETKPGPGVKTETIQVGGQAVTLVNPTVAFAYQSMFPELLVISLLTALTIALVTLFLTRNLQRVPDRRQTFVELVYSALDNFVHGLIGDHYKRYVPLVGTIFIYVLVMNLAGLIPGWASPTANINVPAGLAIVVIVYVQYEGIRANGLKGYLMHFVGDPWWLGPLNFPIHAIGEVARVLSLTIRLFGNIFGEDVVIVILIALAGMFTKGLLPFQFPMYFLAIFTSFVQAMVFSILTCVYIALMTTHEDHGEHGHGHDHGHGHGHDHDDHGHLQEVRPPAPAV